MAAGCYCKERGQEHSGGSMQDTLEMLGAVSVTGWVWIAVGLVVGFLAIALTLGGLAGLYHRRIVGGSGRLACGLILAGGVATGGALALGMQTYERLMHEQDVLVVRFELAGERHYLAEIEYPDGRREQVALMGDEWQVDARILRWEGPAIVLGMDTLFQLERISGRYEDIGEEREAMRSVHGLTGEGPGLDPWNLGRRYGDRMPWVDAVYGSATYLPMAHEAEFEVSVTGTGLASRPINDAAEQAVRRW